MAVRLSAIHGSAAQFALRTSATVQVLAVHVTEDTEAHENGRCGPLRTSEVHDAQRRQGRRDRDTQDLIEVSVLESQMSSR